MNDKSFKVKNKFSVCTKAPWIRYIPFNKRHEVQRQIKMECMDIYGYFFDECPKRLMCISKSCIGRPLPWKSKTARPYLVKFVKDNNLSIDSEYFVEDCSKCLIRNTCSNLCFQIEDFISRRDKKEPKINYLETTENLEIEPKKSEKNNILGNDLKIPWDILSEIKEKVVRGYIYEGKDFKYLADTLNLTNQARVRYEFYSCLNKLSEYATMRKFINENSDKLKDKQLKILKLIYLENKTLTSVANSSKISKQAVQQMISRIINKYNITWQTFVKKQNNKVIYKIPKVLK